MRFFESGDEARRDRDRLPESRLRLGLALVLGATMFGSLWAMADEGPKWAAVLVTIGLAISPIPILLRVLPPLAKDAKTNQRDPQLRRHRPWPDPLRRRRSRSCGGRMSVQGRAY